LLTKNPCNYKLPKRGNIFEPEFIRRLTNFMLRDSNWSKKVKEIRQEFYNENKDYFLERKNYSLSSYWNALTSRRGCKISRPRLSSKMVPFWDDHSLNTERRSYSKKIISFLNKNFNIIYLDESSFNLNFKPDYGYFVRGAPTRIKHIKTKSRNYTLLAAVNNQNGSCKGFDFYQFLSKLIDKFNLQGSRYLIVMDNCKIHKKKEYFPKFSKHINLVSLPCYSPMMNIIELLFANLKFHIKSEIFRDEEHLINSIIKEISNFDESLLPRFESRMFHYMYRLIKFNEL
jgi:transposase